jgi:hypothetical protein
MNVMDKIMLNTRQRKLYRKLHGPETEQEFGESINQQLEELKYLIQ